MKLHSTTKYLPVLALLLSIGSCVKEKISDHDYPRLRTQVVTDITASGAMFKANVEFDNGTEIIDHGFVWKKIGLPYLGDWADKVSLGKYNGNGAFSFKATYGLPPGATIRVRGYIMTDTYTVYGNDVYFASQGCAPAVISTYSPASASIMDTITISGENFSNQIDGNQVYFGGKSGMVVSNKTDELKVIIPVDLDSEVPVITVSTSGNSTNAATPFNLLIPAFTEFNPKSARIDENITITGVNIPLVNGLPNIVRFGSVMATIVSVTRNQIVVKVPGQISLASEVIKVNSFPTEKNLDQSFQLLPPSISSFSPASGGTGKNFTILGSGFHRSLSVNEVYLGGVKLNVSSCTTTELYGYIPAGLGLPTGDYKITVSILGLTTEAPGLFHYTAPPIP